MAAVVHAGLSHYVVTFYGTGLVTHLAADAAVKRSGGLELYDEEDANGYAPAIAVYPPGSWRSCVRKDRPPE